MKGAIFSFLKKIATKLLNYLTFGLLMPPKVVAVPIRSQEPPAEKKPSKRKRVKIEEPPQEEGVADTPKASPIPEPEFDAPKPKKKRQMTGKQLENLRQMHQRRKDEKLKEEEARMEKMEERIRERLIQEMKPLPQVVEQDEEEEDESEPSPPQQKSQYFPQQQPQQSRYAQVANTNAKWESYYQNMFS